MDGFHITEAYGLAAYCSTTELYFNLRLKFWIFWNYFHYYSFEIRRTYIFFSVRSEHDVTCYSQTLIGCPDQAWCHTQTFASRWVPQNLVMLKSIDVQITQNATNLLWYSFYQQLRAFPAWSGISTKKVIKAFLWPAVIFCTQLYLKRVREFPIPFFYDR